MIARKSGILWSSGSPGQAARNVKTPTADWPLSPNLYIDSPIDESPFGVKILANCP